MNAPPIQCPGCGRMLTEEPEGFFEFIDPQTIYLAVIHILEDQTHVHLMPPDRLPGFLQALTGTGPERVTVRRPTDLDIELAAAGRLQLTLAEYRAGRIARARTAAWRRQELTEEDPPRTSGTASTISPPPSVPGETIDT